MSTQRGFEEIAEDMAFLDDWEDRYRYVIELGKAMPPLDEALRTPGAKVDGCASQVWIVPALREGRVAFDGDSDAMIVRGLIAVLRALYCGRTPQEAAALDAQAALARLGLDQALSAQRSNGLRAMVDRLRAFATEAQAA
ncbi:MAG: SufE family protein [Rubrimonas sp.]|uniref:SufE family protein n=1 Tax=Rubrimonas sp. TaxID=2036015 RepID=UPI002FDCB04A